MGRKIVLLGTKLTDTTAPKLAEVDGIESTGSIFMLDPTHPVNPWDVGVPANNATAKNLFAKNAALVVGSTADQMHGTYYRGNGWDGTKGKIERTTKGGLHGIVSPTAADMTTVFFHKMADPIKTHLLNSGHTFFFSAWARATRASASPGVALLSMHASDTNSSSNLLAFHRLGENKPANGRLATTDIGTKISNLYSTGWAGTKPSSINNLFSWSMVLGAEGVFNYQSSIAQLSGSRAYYRIYIEDLTVSGRSYADVDAIDNALYTKEVLTTGGRYFGDTFTDPTTVA